MTTPPFDGIQEEWNLTFKGTVVPPIGTFSKTRRGNISRRWGEWEKAKLDPWEVFTTILHFIRADPWHMNPDMRDYLHRHWKPNIDYLFENDWRSMELYEKGIGAIEQHKGQAQHARRDYEAEERRHQKLRQRDAALRERFNALPVAEQKRLATKAYHRLHPLWQETVDRSGGRKEPTHGFIWDKIKRLMAQEDASNEVEQKGADA